jgi:hypothetical protein
MPTCTRCKSQFENLPEDLEFYKEHDFPLPELCPDCRHQDRCAYRNDRNLYKRNCGMCGKSIVTIFSEDKTFPVYCPECWWGDKWNGLDHGKDFDFSRPFFEQFFELRDKIPRLSLNNAKHVNSDYCSQCVGNKNCYLVIAGDDNEDCMNSFWINRCRDTYNSSRLADSSLCFDVVDSEDCYHCIYSQDLKNCSDCYFSRDLIGCKNCLFCSGLRNKEFYIKNQPCSKEEYYKKMESLDLGSFKTYSELQKLMSRINLDAPRKYIHVINSEDYVGDYIINSKDCHYCFDVFESEKCRYAFNLVHHHYNNRDVSYITEVRNGYQLMSVTGEEIYFGTVSWYSSDIWYCDLVQQCQNCFGCIGLRHNKYCILNKQYSKEEYEKLVPKIIAHMKKTGEWGRFFPVKYSPFAYNETVAQDYFPLKKEAVLSSGWKWRDYDKKGFQSKVRELPDDIKEVSEDICNEALVCADCGRNYKVLPKELNVYKQVGYPLPRLCNNCRILEREKMRNPYKLYERKCDQCKINIKTTYSPKSQKKIYCESCYLKEVY